MGLSKKTLIPVVCKEALFCKKLIKDDGRGMEFYFQCPDYIKEYNYDLPPEKAFESLLLSKFSSFKPTLKFSLPNELLNSPDASTQKLLDLQIGDIVALDFAMSPELIPESRESRANVYASTIYRDILKVVRHSECLDKFYSQLAPASVPTAA
ncbi:hypothetical protein [Okeania sp. SIO2B3]|uniref:hypothetical protein n=1 Tax=Okeania sp. SIO2B3 TaxID=2607784 RepID=UPI0013C06427|nr:hypothetical protein [Okeania sp. SIO2B3]NET46709.1 hypothetical protein [Okeania sp. SIO2B3]